MTQRRSDNATWRRVQRKGVLCARARCLCSKLSRRSHPQPEQVHSARQRDVGWRPATSAATTLTWFTKSSDLPSIFLCPPSRPPKFLWILFFVFFYQALPNPFCFCWAPLSSFFFYLHRIRTPSVRPLGQPSSQKYACTVRPPPRI